MKKVFSRIAIVVGVLAVLSFASSNTFADGIIFVGPNHENKIVPPTEVLSLQHHGNNTSERGGVSFDGATNSDNIFGDTSAGPHNLTVPFAGNAISFGILMNINENNGNANGVLFINNLTLTAYSFNPNTNVTTAIIIGTIENLSLDQIKPAQGSATDYQFGLTSTAAAALQAAFASNPNLRLGLSGTISNVGGGPERFQFNQVVGEVPEPASLLLIGSGLAGLAFKLRRRRNR